MYTSHELFISRGVLQFIITVALCGTTMEQGIYMEGNEEGKQGPFSIEYREIIEMKYGVWG